MLTTSTLAQTMDSGIVAIAFAKTPLSKAQWRNDVESLVTNSLRTAFHQHHPASEAELKFLEGVKSTDVSRTVEIALKTQTQPTLSQCTTVSQSTEVQACHTQLSVELVIQPTHLYTLHQQPGLAVFDMDSTLIQQEVIDELARAVGLYSQVATITEAAMRGEAPYVDFEASLRARVALLKGVPNTIWDQLKSSVITFTPGALELVQTLKALGWKTAVLSGGFTPLANWVKDTLGLDYAFANHLVSDHQAGILTGELVADKPIIHAEKKRELLLQIAAQEGVPVERTIAVGDGSNDLLMMGASGLGIAFNAKPKVQRAAPARLNSPTLLDVMQILGYSQEQVQSLITKAER